MNSSNNLIIKKKKHINWDRVYHCGTDAAVEAKGDGVPFKKLLAFWFWKDFLYTNYVIGVFLSICLQINTYYMHVILVFPKTGITQYSNYSCFRRSECFRKGFPDIFRGITWIQLATMGENAKEGKSVSVKKDELLIHWF